MKSVIVKRVGAVDVYVMENGKFRAIVGDETITTGTLATMEKKLTEKQSGKPVDAMTYDGKMVRVVAKSKPPRGFYNSQTVITDEGQRIVLTQLYHPNAELAPQIQALNQASREMEERHRSERDELHEARHRLSAQLVRMTEQAYDALAAQTDYEDAPSP